MSLLQEIKVPLISVNDTSLTVVEINFENGEKIRKGDTVIVFETSKTTYDVVAENSGYIEYKCEVGNDYEVNTIVANVYSEAFEIKVRKSAKNGTEKSDLSKSGIPVIQWQGEPLFSKEAINLIEKHWLDKRVFHNIEFVSKQDVEEQFKLVSKKVFPADQSSVPKNKISEAKEGVIRQKLTSNKKREIQYLSAVQSAGLTSTINTVIDTFGIFSQINKSLKYFKNSLLPVIIYESSRLLKKYPLLNAYYNTEVIDLYKNINVGFAIDAGKGLKVLKIKDTNIKSIGEIENELMNLSELYLEDKLSLEDLTDITFTVTDLSSEGVSFFQPLINMENSAILGISAIDEKLNRCALSITFDHRVLEGKQGAVFLKELKERLSSYQQLNSRENLNTIKCFNCYKTLAEDLGGVGFVKCITGEGKEAYVCQSCFKGF
jgi:Pyruvate/2-oxoglutarate dehydrogenase complex, dihydrolipoamide acyltransferase (E2) component, and related enzymes